MTPQDFKMPEPKPTCPTCATPGRPVSMRTVRHLSTHEPAWDRAWLCDEQTCAVVYFDGAGARINKSEVRVVVFQKEADPARPVCYCFEHSVADVLGANGTDGSNRVVDEIMAACRRGLDRCEETNPQGRCCLGNVRGLLRAEAAPVCCGGCS